MTKKSELILNMIKNSGGHLTAEQAFIRAKDCGISVSIASIYRILSKLADEGYISRIQIAGQPDVFDKTNYLHGHLKCTNCGQIKDICLDSFKDVLYKATGIDSISGFSLCIEYICENCKLKR